MGKAIKLYHYIPILDDANVNTQGIDALGLIGDAAAVGTVVMTIVLLRAGITANGIEKTAGADIVGDVQRGVFHGYPVQKIGDYFHGQNVDGFTATDQAQTAAIAFINAQLGTAHATWGEALYGATADPTTASPDSWVGAGNYFNDDAEGLVPYGGNLYGSSKDVGTITSKMPALTEMGGEVNHVGVTRIDIEGNIEKFGFYTSYSEESVDFDTDAELIMHVNREVLNAANEMTEDALQIDLLNGAGVIQYGGDATSTGELNGEAGTVSTITYDDLMRLSITLTDNRTPKRTTVITGTRNIDTRVVEAARILYIGSELQSMYKNMADNFGNQAFISVAAYGAAGPTLTGEIGQIDEFKLIVVPEMMHWDGAGAAVVANDGYRESGGNYDVFPSLCVGDKSYSTIGFQTDGKSVKFKIKHSKPGSPESYAQDPYGSKGFISVKWYYGTIIERPERIGLLKSVAPF